MSTTKPIPDGYHAVTPSLSVEGADRAIAFYAKAFGARERFRMSTPDGRVAHAELEIGDSVVMLSEAMREPVTSASLYLYVNDVDAIFARALGAGARVTMPVADMFWGDRCGTVVDPFGIRWGIATRREDVPHEEITRRATTHP